MTLLPDEDAWAVTECAEAELGEARRMPRLVALATVLAQRPGASRPEACGDRAMLKAADRCFDNAAIDPQDLLDSHVDATLTRLATGPLVLAVQETTALDWTTPPATTGLGPLTHPAPRGLHVHTTLAITPERVPLGLLAQPVWARDPEDRGKRTTRKQRPIAEKERQQWRTRVEAVLAARRACPQTRFIRVGDREAEGYDLLAVERPAGVERLIRAAWNRCGTQPEHFGWATVAACPVEATVTVQVPRRAAPPDGHPDRAVGSSDPVSAPALHARAAARRSGPGRPSAGGDAPDRGGPYRVAVADHVWGAHHQRCAGAGRLVGLSLGHGSSLNANDKMGWFPLWGQWARRSECPPCHR